MSADTETYWARSAPLNCAKLKQETEGCVEVRIYMNCYCYHLGPMYISHTRAPLLLKNIKLLKAIYAHTYPWRKELKTSCDSCWKLGRYYGYQPNEEQSKYSYPCSISINYELMEKNWRFSSPLGHLYFH